MLIKINNKVNFGCIPKACIVIIRNISVYAKLTKSPYSHVQSVVS